MSEELNYQAANGINNRDSRTQMIILGSGIFIATFDLAAISIAMLVLKGIWHLSPITVTLIGAAALIGAIFGGFLGGLLADKFGRKGILFLDFVGYFFASSLSAISPNAYWLIFFRLIVGFVIGADFAVSFPLMAEIRPRKTRGRDMAMVMMTANFGMVLAYGIGGFFLGINNNGWRYVLVSGAVLSIPILIIRSRIKESESWKEKRHHTIGNIFRYLRQNHTGDVIFSSVAWFSYQVGDQGLSIFLPILLSSLLFIGPSDASYSSLIIKSVTIPAAIITVLLIERIGRRSLQLWGFLGRTLSLFFLAFMLIMLPDTFLYAKVLFLFTAFFFGAMGPDKTIVIAPSEKFDSSVRGTGEGISEASGRFGGLIGILGYGLLTPFLGDGGGIMFFAIFAMIGLIATLVFMTKDRNEYRNSKKSDRRTL
ncbi:MFS transporter [Cuniculiplasma divulgatum]|nr:MFS transporter [Cuniculiplasma divulgatum]